jgi:hypothetical protein
MLTQVGQLVNDTGAMQLPHRAFCRVRAVSWSGDPLTASRINPRAPVFSLQQAAGFLAAF